MTVKTDIPRAITEEWQSARQIWDRLDCWELATLRQNLLLLARAGAIDIKIVPSPYGDKNLYRRSSGDD